MSDKLSPDLDEARLFVDAARAVENARSYHEAMEREAERERPFVFYDEMRPMTDAMVQDMLAKSDVLKLEKIDGVWQLPAW